MIFCKKYAVKQLTQPCNSGVSSATAHMFYFEMSIIFFFTKTLEILTRDLDKAFFDFSKLYVVIHLSTAHNPYNIPMHWQYWRVRLEKWKNKMFKKQTQTVKKGFKFGQ